MKRKQRSVKPRTTMTKKKPSGKRTFDEASVTTLAFQGGTVESILGEECTRSSSLLTLVGDLPEQQGRPLKRPYQPPSFLNDLQHTIALLHQLEQKAQQEPLALVSRAFDILAEQNGDNTASLQTCCYCTLRSLLCGLFDSLLDREAAIDAVLAAMEKHMWSIMLQLEGYQLLQRFVLTPPHELRVHDTSTSLLPKNTVTPIKTSALRQRALQTIFHSMRHHLDSAAFQYLSLDLIRKLVQTPAEFRLAGGTTILWQTLQTHVLEPPIQQVGLSLLAWLAEDDTCRDLLVNAGALQVIPCLMKLHRLNACIQCNAAAALCWFVHAGGRNGRCELPAQHIPTLLDILELHQDNASAFGNCVCLLCAIQLQDEEEDRVLQIVQNGMKMHVRSAQVQEGCLRWLRLRDPDSITVERLREHLLPLILEGMKHHTRDAHVQTQAIAVLALLASQQSLRQALLQVGAVDAVLESFRQNKNDRPVQEGAIWFLSLLIPSLDEPYVTAFGGGFGVIDLMWQSMVNTDQADEE